MTEVQIHAFVYPSTCGDDDWARMTMRLSGG